ncbi:MAG: NAD(P)H-dependent glycerol-3-phosphate dehydrogenase [Gemmatimonadales bacterium]
MTHVLVLGAGAWGTALAAHLGRKGTRVTLWAYEPEVVAGINGTHRNPLFLPDVELPASVTAVGAVSGLETVDAVLVVAPSKMFRSVLQHAEGIRPGTPIISATKGLEPGSLDLMTEVIADGLPSGRPAVLSGPSFAEEVAHGAPTAVVGAAEDEEVARAVQEIFASPAFRVYASTDVVGVQLGGALKNVIAVAAGMLEGLGLGHNPRAALITRGLAEITRLGEAMGADPRTFAGLAGVGDLVLTTTGSLSRNRQLGEFVGKGGTLAQWKETHRSVAEGADTALTAVELGHRHGVELPLCQQVHAVLYEQKDPRKALVDLMGRPQKTEVWR